METIPVPPGLPLVGNTYDVDFVQQTASLEKLAQEYGPLFEVRLMRESYMVCSSFEIFDELCDEKRFTKHPASGMWQLRHGLGDGLFTAQHGEHNWNVAHRVLTPVFGPLAVEKMFDGMQSIASQLVLKWARHGSEHRIDSTEDFTRLTLDTIALCSMSIRFNSFYRDEIHPFAQSMSKVMLESGRRGSRSDILNALMWRSSNEFFRNIETMRSICQAVIDERRAKPCDQDDLVSTMLSRKDPKTGEIMSDDNIINNMITFLVAGHETTSGFLAFLFYELTKNPSELQKAQEEIDQVIGASKVELGHLNCLPFTTACLREAIRLHPPAAATYMITNPDNSDEFVTLGGGRYKIRRGTVFRNLIRLIQSDAAVYGTDSNVFRPERMLEDKFKQYPRNSWKPFGNGSRSCIGRDFAWQEALLVAIMLLQNFDLTFEDPSYQLQIQQTLTVKPKNMFLRAVPRKGLDAFAIEGRLQSGTSNMKTAEAIDESTMVPENGSRRPMSVFYGGNMGTCGSLAQSIVNPASHHGFEVVVKSLDEAINSLPQNQPVLIITSTYEGQPPDNATKFMQWIQETEGSPFSGVSYAVFGCGNRNWKDTFQRIPKLADASMLKSGGLRMANRGATDAADGNIFDDFEKWEDEFFWPSVKEKFGLAGEEQPTFTNRLDCVMSSSCGAAQTSAHGVKDFLVLENKAAAKGHNTDKRHLELQLPADISYRAGDYLTVLPLNPVPLVERVMRRFSLPDNGTLYIKSRDTFLPHDTLLHTKEVLGSFVEISQPATRRNIKILLTYTHNPATKMMLKSLSGQYFTSAISQKRTTLLDILETYPGINIPFQDYLALLPQLRPRYYSISSSPMASSRNCTLTFSVQEGPAWTNRSKHYLGIATNHMASLQPGDYLHANVKSSTPAFHLPSLERSSLQGASPIIMVCAGTGIAPFRGFIEERAMLEMQTNAGKLTRQGDDSDTSDRTGGPGSHICPMILYAGHRNAEDRMYEDELQKWSLQGVVDVRWVSSRPLQPSKPSAGCRERQANIALRRSYSEAQVQAKQTPETGASPHGGRGMYVQDRLWTDRHELRALIDGKGPNREAGAILFVCGSRTLVRGVETTLKKLRTEWDGGCCDVDSAERWLDWMKETGAYVADAFD